MIQWIMLILGIPNILSNSILKLVLNFWKCVGDNQMRGCLPDLWDAHLPRRLRKGLKNDFRVQFPGNWFEIGIILNYFLKLFNLGYSDLSFIDWVRKSWKSRDSTELCPSNVQILESLLVWMQQSGHHVWLKYPHPPSCADQLQGLHAGKGFDPHLRWHECNILLNCLIFSITNLSYLS